MLKHSTSTTTMAASAQITLYLRPSWSSLFPHILLHEQGLFFNTIGVTDRTVTEDPSYAARNPKKQIPVLFIDDQAVTENPAIAHAIHSLNPGNRLFGQDTQEFIKVCEWMNWTSASFHAQAWSPYLRPWRFTSQPAGEAAVRAAALDKLRDRFDLIESWLSEEGWAVGDDFTAVDAYLLPYYQWAAADDEACDVQTRCPKYAALMQKVTARSSVQKAMRREAEIKEEMGGEGAFEGNR